MKFKKDNPVYKNLPGRRWLCILFLISLSFLIYGSLVPFIFIYKASNDALNEFLILLSQGFFVKSRTDLGENYLLMIPVAFFLMGVVWSNTQTLFNVILSGLVWVFCSFSSFVVEFSQMFIVNRTSAVSDILMQSLGAATGILFWWVWGHRLWEKFFLQSVHGKTIGTVEKILWIYLLILFGYNIVPFDLTINPFAISNKFKAGRVLLIPFSFGYNSAFEFIYAITIDTIVWIPVGFLILLRGKKTPLKAFVWVTIAVSGIELFQIFVSSRIASTTDIITGSIGGLIGILLCIKLPFFNQMLPEYKKNSDRTYRLAWIGIGLFVIWLGFLALLFWYPYDILVERRFIEYQLGRFFRAPMYAYYQSSGLQALSAVFRKVFFFLPLGIFLAVALKPFAKFNVKSIFNFLALLLCAGSGLFIELGQVIMPHKLPDTMDVLFNTGGGFLGFLATNRFINR